MLNNLIFFLFPKFLELFFTPKNTPPKVQNSKPFRITIFLGHPVEIQELNPRAFSIILNYIYAGKEPNVKVDNVESLLEAACFLQLNHIKELCLDHLKDMIDIGNVLELSAFASRYNFTDLIETSKRFLKMNFYQIATSPSFLNLSEEEVGIIISGDIADVNKQAENGLQSRSSENGSVALWNKIAVILNWR